MFYKTVKAAWDTGRVHIGLPAFGLREPTITGNTWKLSVMTLLLSELERQALIDQAVREADCVAAIAGDVDEWSAVEHAMVERALRNFGCPRFPPSEHDQEALTPQRRLLLWKGSKLMNEVRLNQG